MKEDFYKAKTAYELCKEMCSGIGVEIVKSSVYEDNNNIEISSYEILARNKVIRIFLVMVHRRKSFVTTKMSLIYGEVCSLLYQKRCIKRNIH